MVPLPQRYGQFELESTTIDRLLLHYFVSPGPTLEKIIRVIGTDPADMKTLQTGELWKPTLHQPNRRSTSGWSGA
jgi:hypothetical protein